jgi:hypothetical protein
MGRAIRIAAIAAAMLISGLISARVSAGQDQSGGQGQSLGDLARATREKKPDSPHAAKVVTDEDFGPHIEPIGEKEDPADVVNKSRAALVADRAHTCRREMSNNSGPGSSTETVAEIAGPERMHLTTNRTGGLAPGHSELIIIGKDMYHREGSGPWMKDSARSSFPGPIGGVPDGLSRVYSAGVPAKSPWGTNLSMIAQENVSGSATFVYEDKFHPGGVDTRTQTDDIWVGANDHLPRKAQTVLVTSNPGMAAIVDRDTMVCSYGTVPEIKPPM